VCGRYRLTTKAEELAQRYHAQMAENLELSPSWNVAPGQDVLAVRLNPETRERSLDALHWGLIPHWAKDKKIGYRTINARSETVDKTPAFRQAFRKRRCLVCADGFYEWRREADRKVPYYFQLKTSEPFAFAGLWENWQDPASGEWLRSCTILTTEANALVRETHNRMPVILPETRHAAWLGEPSDASDLKALLKPLDPGFMEAWEVSPQVNSPRNNGPQLIEPYSGGQAPAPDAQVPDSA
jgi:putative SOS response-associated peptidase YedK